MCYRQATDKDHEKATETDKGKNDLEYDVRTIENGAWFTKKEHFDPARLGYMTDKNDKFIITYNHDKRIFIQSGDFVGDIKAYASAFPNSGPCVYIKKGEVVEQVKRGIEKMLKKPIKFYGKNDSELMGCFIDTVKNMDNNFV